MTRRLLMAAFDDEHAVTGAVRALRTRGYSIVDVFSPYPVHGLDREAGVRPSRLGWVCAVAGFSGAGLILLFEIWTSSSNWALNVGGKPYNSFPAFIPVTFEVGVLAAGLMSVLAFLFRSRLFPGKKPPLQIDRATDDRFTVVIEELDASFDPVEVKRLCEESGAVAVNERIVQGRIE